MIMTTETLVSFKACGDGEAAVTAEGAGGYFNAGGRLPPLVLAGIYQPGCETDDFFIGAGGYNLLDAFIFLHVSGKYGVEHIVRREGVGIRLVGPEFGGRRLFDNRGGDKFASGLLITVSGKLIYHRLGDVFDDGKTAGHITV